jgi:LytS/YehU family sensor histidine kinase
MLRYVFYDCSKDQVKIDKEIDYIKNFIAFQQMKSDDEQNISFSISNCKTNLSISPMLFIPFIENAFKYSNLESQTKAYTRIKLESDEKNLFFTIENSVPANRKIPSGDGTGILNVKKRLDLLYPEKHCLKIENEEVKFIVSLKINLS